VFAAQARGNDAFKRGVQLRKKFYLREAADLYTQGLAAGSGESSLDAVLYANRAEVRRALQPAVLGSLAHFGH
jgi:hypothetical protein